MAGTWAQAPIVDGWVVLRYGQVVGLVLSSLAARQRYEVYRLALGDWHWVANVASRSDATEALARVLGC